MEQRDAVLAAIALTEASGITVIRRSRPALCLMVIDESLVWYGDISPLAYPIRDVDAIRFDSTDLAGELPDPLNGSEEQVGIEEI